MSTVAAATTALKAAAPPPAADSVIQSLPVARIAPSPLNPYKDPGDLATLAASIKEVGVLQPVLVRSKGADAWELICGHRRLAAATIAGRTEIPAIVRIVGDDEVVVEQLVENGERRGEDPLAEAEGYRMLRDRFGLSADAIADRVGKKRRTVYTRLQLATLAPEAKKALAAGKLSASVALVVARLPSAELQRRAFKDLTQTDGETMSYREAARHVEETYLVDVSKAPFHPQDGKLLPEAGACSACPKRTGNAPDLFADTKNGNLCTDLGCYRKKCDASWALQAKAAKEIGRRVLTDDQAKNLFWGGANNELRGNAVFVDADDTTWKGNKKVKWRDLLDAEAKEKFVLARDPSGRVRELVPESALPKERCDPFAGSRREDAAAKRRERQHRIRTKAAELAVAGIVAAAETRKVDSRLLRWLAAGVWDQGTMDQSKATFQRRVPAADRGVAKGRYGGFDAAAAWDHVGKGMTDEQLVGVLVELATRGRNGVAVRYHDGTYTDSLRDACKFFGVKLEAIEARLEAEAKAKAKGKKKAKKGKA